MRIFPEEFSGGRGGRSRDTFNPAYSGKFLLMDSLLRKLRKETDDRIVIVSNYTQTLDLFVKLCCKRRWPYIKLDGGTAVKKRTAMVHRFNDKNRDEFVFLLSSKAGGCGLNLIGGNRLVLFDPDWYVLLALTHTHSHNKKVSQSQRLSGIQQQTSKLQHEYGETDKRNESSFTDFWLRERSKRRYFSDRSRKRDFKMQL